MKMKKKGIGEIKKLSNKTIIVATIFLINVIITIFIITITTIIIIWEGGAMAADMGVEVEEQEARGESWVSDCPHWDRGGGMGYGGLVDVSFC